MTSYVVPKKNSAFITYVALESQAAAGTFKSSPTLASGDFQSSRDGGALANLATLPTNTPGGVMVKISLSAGEMNGDNITVVCIDAAGAEWYDLVLNIQTSARQIDDLATPTNITAGTITTVTNLTNLPAAAALEATLTEIKGAGWVSDYSVTSIWVNTDNLLGSISPILDALGAWTGSGINNVLGAFKALMSKAASAPSDIGGTFDPATDSAETISETVNAISGSAGAGAISYPITVQDEDSNPIDGVEVWISTDNPATNIVAGTLSTDALGLATFMLDAGTYYAWRQKSGYNFTNPVTIVVS